MPEGGWVSRFFRYLSRFFAKPPAPIAAAPVGSSVSKPPEIASRLLKQSFPATATVSSSSTAAAAAPSSSQAEGKSGMHTTISRLAQEMAKVGKHTPMIKFIGSRKPQPKFDSSSLPSLAQASSNAPSSSKPSDSELQQQKPPSSIGKVGTTPRGSGIDESELPAFLRRRLPDADEIAAINIGSAYGQ